MWHLHCGLWYRCHGKEIMQLRFVPCITGKAPYLQWRQQDRWAPAPAMCCDVPPSWSPSSLLTFHNNLPRSAVDSPLKELTFRPKKGWGVAGAQGCDVTPKEARGGVRGAAGARPFIHTHTHTSQKPPRLTSTGRAAAYTLLSHHTLATVFKWLLLISPQPRDLHYNGTASTKTASAREDSISPVASPKAPWRLLICGSTSIIGNYFK